MTRNELSIRKRGLKKIEENIVTIVLNILYDKKAKIYPPYVSKINSNWKKKLFF